MGGQRLMSFGVGWRELVLVWFAQCVLTPIIAGANTRRHSRSMSSGAFEPSIVATTKIIEALEL